MPPCARIASLNCCRVGTPVEDHRRAVTESSDTRMRFSVPDSSDRRTGKRNVPYWRFRLTILDTIGYSRVTDKPAVISAQTATQHPRLAAPEVVQKSSSSPSQYSGDPAAAHVPEAGFWPTSGWQTADPQSLVGIPEVFFSRPQTVHSGETLFSSGEPLLLLCPSTTLNGIHVCCPMYQGALTAKMRSLPRARSTHSRRWAR